MTHEPPKPVAIPTPPDFPIEWAQPEDQHLPLMRDRQHSPGPVTPLTGQVHERHFAGGSTTGFQRAGQPLRAMVRRINAYYYLAILPSVPPEQMPEVAPAAEAGARTAIERFVDRWDNEWVPEVQGYYQQWESFDLGGASLAQLLEHLDWSLTTFERFWAIHMEVAIPFMLAPSMFQDLYADLFESDEPLDAYALLQGIDNRSLMADRALWALGRAAAAEPSVAAVIRDTPTANVLPALEGSDEGRAFLATLQSYLAEFGRRSDTVIELADPSWVESPGPVIDNLKHYLAPDARDPDVHWQELVAAREQRVAAARERIASYPEPVRQQFEGLLAAAQQGHRIQEDHNWWLDQGGMHYLRRVLMEVGRRLATTGAIETPGDVFYLTLEELRAALESGSAEHQTLVAERKAEMARWSQVAAPPMVGTDYGPPPDNPIGRAISRFFGAPPPALAPDHPELIGGNAGSPGKATGRAKVIITLDEAGKLEEGDILVTATTSPPWTPLFATAAGVVADTGGVLSHCAIVAREYAIPAVLGTGRGTVAIRDGQLIEVDGDRGEVRLLE